MTSARLVPPQEARSQEASDRVRKHESGNGQRRVQKQLEASQETKVINVKITTGNVSQKMRFRNDVVSACECAVMLGMQVLQCVLCALPRASSIVP